MEGASHGNFLQEKKKKKEAKSDNLAQTNTPLSFRGINQSWMFMTEIFFQKAWQTGWAAFDLCKVKVECMHSYINIWTIMKVQFLGRNDTAYLKGTKLELRHARTQFNTMKLFLPRTIPTTRLVDKLTAELMLSSKLLTNLSRSQCELLR